AAIKRQRAPAAAKRRDAPITVLQVEQPLDAQARGFADALVRHTEVSQRQKRASGVVCVWHAAWQISPGPATRRGVGVRMNLAILLREQPVTNGRWPIANRQLIALHSFGNGV